MTGVRARLLQTPKHVAGGDKNILFACWTVIMRAIVAVLHDDRLRIVVTDTPTALTVAIPSNIASYRYCTLLACCTRKSVYHRSHPNRIDSVKTSRLGSPCACPLASPQAKDRGMLRG